MNSSSCALAPEAKLPDKRVIVRLLSEGMLVSRIRHMPVTRLDVSVEHGSRRDVICEVVKWMARRAQVAIPGEAFEGADFDTGLAAAAPARAVNATVDGQAFWGGALRFPDSTVPSRSWHAEIVISDESPVDRVAVRLTVIDTSDGLASKRFERTVPGFVRQICDVAHCPDGQIQVLAEPLQISSLDEFDAVVFDYGRRKPILIFGGFPADSAESTSFEDIEWLAQQVCGAVHVAQLGSSVTDEVKRRYGKQFSVYGRAAKLYFADIEREGIRPFHHPLFNLNRVAPRWLRDHLLWRAMTLPQAQPLPRLADLDRLRSVPLAPDSQSAEALTAQLDMANDEIDRLKRELAETDQLFDEAAEQCRIAEQRVGAAEAESERYREDNDFLSAALVELAQSHETRLKLALPSREVFSTWLVLACGGSVVMTERARDAVANLPEDEGWLERFGIALQGIGDMVEGRIPPTGRNIPLERGVEIAPCGKIEGFTQYSFTHEGRRLRSDWHAKWGNGTDIRHAFRIYFHWDKALGRAVVQSVDEHFDNLRTN